MSTIQTVTTEGFGPAATIPLVTLMGYGGAAEPEPPEPPATLRRTKDGMEVNRHFWGPHDWDFKVGRRG